MELLAVTLELLLMQFARVNLERLRHNATDGLQLRDVERFLMLPLGWGSRPCSDRLGGWPVPLCAPFCLGHFLTGANDQHRKGDHGCTMLYPHGH